MVRKRDLRLKAPYSKRIPGLDPVRIDKFDAYPFCLPLFQDRSFELAFERAVTIIIGENGAGKSTLLEAIAALAGYDDAGGGKGYMPVLSFSETARNWRGPRQCVARAKNHQRMPFAPKAFSPSHVIWTKWQSGSGFPVAFARRGIFAFLRRTVPEARYLHFRRTRAVLSPARQIEFLKLLKQMDEFGCCQVVMATHSPILMAHRMCAALLQITKYGLQPVKLKDTNRNPDWVSVSFRPGARRPIRCRTACVPRDRANRGTARET